MLLNRRAWLFGCTALVTGALMPSLAWADGGQFPDLSNWSKWSPMKRSQKINQMAVSSYAKKNIPIKAMETKVQYKARIRNLVEKMNVTAEYAAGSSRAAAQSAAATSAVAAQEAALQKSTYGLMSGMGRLGLRMGLRALNWVALGMTLWYVGTGLYNAVWGATDTAADMMCAVGTTCKVTVNGKTSVQATTREYASAQSNWSLSGHNWYVRKSTYFTPPDKKPGYYVVYWNWQEHNGYTAATFDPQLEFTPFLRGVGGATLRDQLATNANYNKGVSRAEMAELLDQAVAGAVKENPDAFPEGWAESKPGVPDQRPAVTADDFWMYDDGVKDVKFSDYISGIAEGVQTGLEQAFDGLFNPEEVAEDATSHIPDTYTPTPTNPYPPGTGTPTPTPTPTPTTPTNCLPGDAACPTKVDWGAPPAEPTGSALWPSWFPSPFVAPSPTGSCTQFQMDAGFLGRAAGMVGSKFDAGWCQFMPQLKAVTKPISTMMWTVAAGVILLRR